MKDFEKFKFIYQQSITGGISIISVIINDRLKASTPNKFVSLPLMMLFVYIIVTIFTNIVEKIIDNSPIIRKRILKNEFLEGYWIDISTNKVDGKVTQGALIHIFYENGEIKISGISFNEEGNKIAAFNSEYTATLGKTFNYLYKTQSIYAPEFQEEGIGQLSFDHPPISYSGFFMDFTSGTKFRLNGQKVPKKDYLSYNRFATIKDKTEYVTYYIKKNSDRIINGTVHDIV